MVTSAQLNNKLTFVGSLCEHDAVIQVAGIFTIDVFTIDVFTIDVFTIDVFTRDVFTLDVFTMQLDQPRKRVNDT